MCFLLLFPKIYKGILYHHKHQVKGYADDKCQRMNGQKFGHNLNSTKTKHLILCQIVTIKGDTVAFKT